MMVRSSLLVAAILSLLAGEALAQVAGSIAGTVLDQTGNPLRGVKVSARSDTMIGGAKVVYTNEEGAYRLRGWPPACSR